MAGKKKDHVGWIKLYRQVTDSSIWDIDDPYDKRSAWVYLLLSANHEDKDIVVKNSTITVHRGQRFTSVRKLSETFKWTKDKTLAFLRQLERLGMVTRDATHSGTLITIVKYEEYQG